LVCQRIGLAKGWFANGTLANLGHRPSKITLQDKANDGRRIAKTLVCQWQFGKPRPQASSKITNKVKRMMGEGSPKFHIGEPGASQKREKIRQRGGLPMAVWQT